MIADVTFENCARRISSDASKAPVFSTEKEGNRFWLSVAVVDITTNYNASFITVLFY